jgi:biopolymer transport protein ExbD
MIQKPRKHEDLLINMTPMIDVMIFLIVFFLAATNFAQVERQQDVELPETRPGGALSTTLDSTLIVNVKKDGQIYVAEKKLSDAELTDLVSRRHEVFKSALRVDVRGDQRAAHGDMCRVYRAIRRGGVARPAIILKETTFEG